MRAIAGARESERGLTLVEVLVSLLLLSFVALSSMSLITVVLKQNKLAGRRTEATSLAVERIDNLTAREFQSSANYLEYKLVGETAAAGPPQTLTSDFGGIPGFPAFRRVVTLEYNVPVAGMLKAKVAVSWVDRSQGLKSHALTTYLHAALDAR